MVNSGGPRRIYAAAILCIQRAREIFSLAFLPHLPRRTLTRRQAFQETVFESHRIESPSQDHPAMDREQRKKSDQPQAAGPRWGHNAQLESVSLTVLLVESVGNNVAVPLVAARSDSVGGMPRLNAVIRFSRAASSSRSKARTADRPSVPQMPMSSSRASTRSTSSVSRTEWDVKARAKASLR